MKKTIIPHYIPRLLIIDDEKYNIEFLQIVLSHSGYIVESAQSGAEGRRKAETFQPDMILLDILMPSESGYETCALLKQNPETSHIPIIFLTALDDHKNFRRGLDAGATDFIAKPFEYREVLMRIRLHLKLLCGDKFMFTGKLLGSDKPVIDHVPEFPMEKICPFYDDQEEADAKDNSFCEIALISPGLADIIMLEFRDDESTTPSNEKIREIISLSIGPHYTTSEIMRDLGLRLSALGYSEKTEAKLIHIDLDNDLATIVNAGETPLIHLDSDNQFTFIEPQTFGAGSTGLGYPPCSTVDFKQGHRLIACTPSFLSGFKTLPAGIVELQNTASATAQVDIKTACEAIGRTIGNPREKSGELVVLQR
ncbi:response regulator [Maridesulfovibrio bastinii]|uniref:response regulator n=1 Tax=Maridesulfovibrio bastinii TaxID=47157 RepID=UPI00041A4EB3|nr:response regulator [Maridesulfovibrio bastinii]